MDIKINDVHVGHAIQERIEELRMTKTEFGRLIGIPQQHVNRILERDTMETKKLVKVCEVLGINIFAQFCSFQTNIGAYLNAISKGDGKMPKLEEASALAELEIKKVENAHLQKQIEILESFVEQYKSQLKDKDTIIGILSKSREL
jgi:transcriptional regulator with XRE-family HTH domain